MAGGIADWWHSGADGIAGRSIFNCNISDNVQAMAFKLLMMVDMHGVHTHARFDDLDLDFENV